MERLHGESGGDYGGTQRGSQGHVSHIKGTLARMDREGVRHQRSQSIQKDALDGIDRECAEGHGNLRNESIVRRREKNVNLRNAIRSEDTEQINVMEWARWNVNKYPELKWLHHIPNGGSRNKREAVKLKQMGVKAGVSDICLPYGKGIYIGLYIEMKYGNNRKTEEQKEFLQDMEKAGHFVATCYSAEDAIRVIEEYLNLGRVVLDDGKTVYMSIPNNSTIKDGVIRETRRGGRGNKDQT